MKKLLIVLSSALVFTACNRETPPEPVVEIEQGASTPAGFSDNLDLAFERVATSGKNVFVCFSGSDWCGWCKKLEQEVFSQAEFIDAASKDFELVFIDMPQNKDVLSERAKTENPKLVKKYGIQGFPTAYIFNAKGEKIGQTGYRRGGAKAYAEYLKGLLSGETAEALAVKWVEPYADRQRKIMEELNEDCGKFQKAKMAEGMSEMDAREASKQLLPGAADKLEKLLKEVESLKVPAAVEEMHQQQIEAQKRLIDIIRTSTEPKK